MDNDQYQFTVGSDVQRDGMFVEVADSAIEPPGVVAEVFCSDVTHSVSLSCVIQDVPLAVIERLIKVAHERLIPKDQRS